MAGLVTSRSAFGGLAYLLGVFYLQAGFDLACVSFADQEHGISVVTRRYCGILD